MQITCDAYSGGKHLPFDSFNSPTAAPSRH